MKKIFLNTTTFLLTVLLVGNGYCEAQIQDPVLLLAEPLPLIDTTLIKPLTTSPTFQPLTPPELIIPPDIGRTTAPVTDSTTDPAVDGGASTLDTPASTGTTTPDAITPDATGAFVPPVTDTRNPPADSTAPSTTGSTNGATTGTFVPRQPPGPTVVVPEENLLPECPPINPLSGQNVECPKTETVPVIPSVPYILLATPLLGVLIFWLVISLLAKQQTAMERQFSQKHLSSHHRQNVKDGQTGLYREIVEFISSNLSSGTRLDPTSLQKFSAQIELLGSNDMKIRHQELLTACQSGNRDLIKQSLKNFTAQIKKEL